MAAKLDGTIFVINKVEPIKKMVKKSKEFIRYG